jgi:hypothetical protein
MKMSYLNLVLVLLLTSYSLCIKSDSRFLPNNIAEVMAYNSYIEMDMQTALIEKKEKTTEQKVDEKLCGKIPCAPIPDHLKEKDNLI